MSNWGRLIEISVNYTVKHYSPTGDVICSLSDAPIRRAYNSGNVAVCIFKRGRVAFTRLQNFEDWFSERRGILSGVKKCCRPEKLMFLVRNDNLLLKIALLFGALSTKCVLFLLCNINFLHTGEDSSALRKAIFKILDSGERYASPLENAHSHIS